jgi:NTE family protein
MKIGLALGGGVARGFFHVGALKSLEKLKLKFNVVAGSSIGAVIGGLYALSCDSHQVEKIAFKVLDKYQKDLSFLKICFTSNHNEGEKVPLEKYFKAVKDFCLWNLRIIKPSLVESKPFLKIFKEIFRNSSFSDCKIPFMATGVDLVKGEVVALKDGPLYRGILASSSYPGIFPPLRWQDKLIIDGGVLAPVPVRIIRKRMNFIVGINLENAWPPSPQIKSAIDILSLTDRIRYKRILEESIKEVDFLIAPDLEDFPLADFSRARELVKRGEKDTLEKGEELIKILKKEKIKSFFFYKAELEKGTDSD